MEKNNNKTIIKKDKLYITKENKYTYNTFSISYIKINIISENNEDINNLYSSYYMRSYYSFILNTMKSVINELIYSQINDDIDIFPINSHFPTRSFLNNLFPNFTKKLPEKICECMDLMFVNVKKCLCVFSDMKYVKINNEKKYKEYCFALNYLLDGIFFYINNFLKLHLKYFIKTLCNNKDIKLNNKDIKLNDLVNIKNKYLNKLTNSIYELGLYFNIRKINDNSIGFYYINSITSLQSAVLNNVASNNNFILNLNKLIRNITDILNYNRNNERNELTYHLLDKILSRKNPNVIFNNDVTYDYNLMPENILLYLDHLIQITNNQQYIDIIYNNDKLLSICTDTMDRFHYLIEKIKEINNSKNNLENIINKFYDYLPKIIFSSEKNKAEMTLICKSNDILCPDIIKNYIKMNEQYVKKIPEPEIYYSVDKDETENDILNNNILDTVYNKISGINIYFNSIIKETSYINVTQQDIDRNIYDIDLDQHLDRYLKIKNSKCYNLFGVFDVIYKYVFIWLHLINIEFKCRNYSKDIEILNKTQLKNNVSYKKLQVENKNIIENSNKLFYILNNKYKDIDNIVLLYQSKFNKISKLFNSVNFKIDNKYTNKYHLYTESDDKSHIRARSASVLQDRSASVLQAVVQEYCEWKSVLLYIQKYKNASENINTNTNTNTNTVSDIQINNINDVRFDLLIYKLKEQIDAVLCKLKNNLLEQVNI